jgi:hypothetical protein
VEGVEFRDLSSIFGYEHIVILRRAHTYEAPHQAAFRQTLLDFQKASAKN